ncbi:ABC transporter permease [Fenollaria massiliensis]|uniref:ABC transporter permease n=1 Tax=Fenollaria massiliensis TaxID=938288 RepID=A0A9E7IUB7_9FIRM|nr:ABC transporter permease [Fenollaria massiliensis]UQK58988.1 ABC transporter permease [Fenollaria massiliensis]
MLIIEIIILCVIFFALCYLGTGKDEKNLKSYASYPDEVQKRIREADEYQGKFHEANKLVTWFANLVVFLVLFMIFGAFIREKDFTQNFIKLLILGQALNIFDLLVIDLLWWRNSKRIRLTKVPEKELYQNPKKHIEAFFRAIPMYIIVAAVDGYFLTLF